MGDTDASSIQSAFGYGMSEPLSKPVCANRAKLDDEPYVDAPEGETLAFGGQYDTWLQFRGPAHLSGKKVISSETGALTGAYSLFVPRLVWQLSNLFVTGVTHNIIHGAAYSGEYPNTTWPGYTTFTYQVTEMWSRIQPAWLHIKDTLDWVARNQYVMRQGFPKIDLAFYLYKSPWGQTVSYSSTNLIDLGYSYEYLGPENLVSPDAAVVNGVLAPKGPAYRALIFQADQLIFDEVLQQALTFSKKGLKIFVVGTPERFAEGNLFDRPKPQLSAYQTLVSSENVHQITGADELPNALSKSGVLPRVSLSCTNQGAVLNLLRADTSGSQYLLLMNINQTARTSCEVRLSATSGMRPFVLDTWNGKQSAVGVCKLSGSTYALSNVSLEAAQSLTIAMLPSSSSTQKPCVLSHATQNLNAVTYSEKQTFLNLLGNVTVRYASGRTTSYSVSPPPSTNLTTWNITIDDYHGSSDPLEIENQITKHELSNQTLKPWTQLGAGFDVVSGVGHYSSTFSTPKVSSLSTSKNKLGAVLHLGQVVHTMRAFIDGKKLPVINPNGPTLDVSDYLKPGKTQEIEIEVTTPLFNRVRSQANVTLTWGKPADYGYKYESQAVQQYGLLGPVYLQWMERVPVQI